MRAIANDNANLRCLQLPSAQIVEDPSILLTAQPQHVIFCTTLLNYLDDKDANGLVRGLYDLLLPGGTLALCNARAPNDYFWDAEFVSGWSLNYRTTVEMTGLTRGLSSDASVHVDTDTSETQLCLVVRKP